MKTSVKLLVGHIIRVCKVFLPVVGLVGLITSCETEYIPDTLVPAIPSVLVQEGNFTISVRFAGYGEGDLLPEEHRFESEADSILAARNMEPETKVIRVDDDVLIYATLAVDPVESHPVRTRAFAPGAKIHIVAYDSTAVFTKVYDALYEVNTSSVLVRDGGSTDLINLPAGNYKLIAYSYNDSTTVLPVFDPVITAIDPKYDLIWGSSPTVYVPDGTITNIPITMVHKLSQVTLVAKTRDGSGISAFSNVTIPGYTVDMTTQTGALAANTPVIQTFTFPTLGPDSIRSDTRIVYTGTPGDMPTIISIGSITVNGKPPLNGFPATFAKSLQSGYSYTMTMRIGESTELTDDQPPAGFTPFVGAFWRAAQTGERLIRMPRVSSGDADGVWTAQVIEGRDWIVLDTIHTTDPGIYTSSAMLGNNTSFDATHPVLSTSTFVSGFLRADTATGFRKGDDEIYFRIGLKTPYPPTSTQPARYGFVLLTYSHNNLRQRIWVRQGEGADYLMRDVDAVSSGDLTERTVTRKFSPYNVTAATLDAPVSINGVPYSPPLQPEQPAVFTDYPSKAGAMFQWANNGVGADNRTRYAWDSFILTPAPGFEPDDYPMTGYWTAQSGVQALAAIHETCPPGFRRPSDGLTYTADPVPTLSASEWRQSLYDQPGPGVSNLVTNSAFGYYADGYFDRLKIESSPGNNPPTEQLTVSATNKDIAHAGKLFYNPNNFASLFFPAAGSRTDQGLSSIGHARYLTSTSSTQTNIWFSDYTNSLTANRISNFERDYAMPVRCVQRPDGTLLCFNNSTQGNEFWVSFGRNTTHPYNEISLELRVASAVTTTVTLQFTDTIASVTYPVIAGNVLHIDLEKVPFPSGTKDMRSHVYLPYQSNINGSTNKTVKITSPKLISVYAFNTGAATTDATALLPVTAWGQEYYRLTSQPAFIETQNPQYYDFEMIIANQDGTVIYDAGTGLSLATINASEVYYNLSAIDRTGRHIFANKPVAYFTHSTGVQEPPGRVYIDILFEQLAPVNQWGNRFLVPNAPEGANDLNNRLRVIASQNNTKIIYTGATFVGGTSLASGGTLNAGQWAELEITGSNPATAACYIEADKPVGVADFMMGSNGGPMAGDPSVCWIPAVDRQMVQEEIIAPFMFDINSSDYTRLDEAGNMHYMIIISPTATATQTTVNNMPLTSGWVNNPSGFSHYIWNFQSATTSAPGDINESFEVKNNNGIIVLCGGVAQNESYYYNAGAGTCDVAGN
ncbi:MAG: fimbrillin family protein [Tannerella sp.]|jgi:hypothetical protein|nr:fimbrillin family protein [Tannerella sp.]